MSPVNPHRPFTPDPEVDSLRPARTGNQINGLDEAEAARATPARAPAGEGEAGTKPSAQGKSTMRKRAISWKCWLKLWPPHKTLRIRHPNLLDKSRNI